MCTNTWLAISAIKPAVGKLFTMTTGGKVRGSPGTISRLMSCQAASSHGACLDICAQGCAGGPWRGLGFCSMAVRSGRDASSSPKQDGAVSAGICHRGRKQRAACWPNDECSPVEKGSPPIPDNKHSCHIKRATKYLGSSKIAYGLSCSLHFHMLTPSGSSTPLFIVLRS